jgi:hypothetical protein
MKVGLNRLAAQESDLDEETLISGVEKIEKEEESGRKRSHVGGLFILINFCDRVQFYCNYC